MSALLPRVVSVTVLVAVVAALIRTGDGSKAWDKALFAVAVASTVLLCIRFRIRPATRTSSVLISLCASAGILVGIGWIEHPELTFLLWEGFGVPVMIGTALLSVFLWRAIDRVQSSRALRTVVTVGITLIAACDLANLIRTLSYLADANNNVFVLNEVLAPAAGKVSDATFVPQYVTLYGWLLVPFRSVVNARDLAQLGVLLLSCLAVMSVLLAVAVAARTMPSRSLWIAAAVVIPLACVTGLHGAAAMSSINSYMQELPPRMFPNMFFSLLGIEELSRLRSGSVRRWHLTALGVLAGLIVWNSQDFGLAVAVAYCLVLAVGLPAPQIRNGLMRWAGGLIVGLAAYPALARAAGARIQLSDFALFSRAYAGGFFSARIQVPGPVLVVLPLLLSSAAVGWCLLWGNRTRARTDSPSHDRAILTLAFVGTWGIAGFVYYLNRSYASAQLQILLVPGGVCIVALLSLGLDARSRLGEPPGARASLRTSLQRLPLALLASLAIASILQSPNPVRVADNLTDPAARFSFESQLIHPSDLRSVRAYVKRKGGSLGYFGNNGNYVHLATGIPTVILFDDPELLISSATLRSKACAYLAAHATTWIFVSPTDQQLFGTEVDVCDLYRPVNPPSVPTGILFERDR